MTVAAWGDALLDLAASIRESDTARCFAVVAYAAGLGAQVILKSAKDPRRDHASADLNERRPKIFVYRRSSVGFERVLKPDEDHVLTPRERFSVAHELGHWLALAKLGIEPAGSRGREYWEQEAAIDAFAGSVLVPRWLAKGWLRQCGSLRNVHPFHLREWSESARVSEEVAAHAVVRLGHRIGFLKLKWVERRRDSKRVLQVAFVASSTALALPKIHSHVTDAALEGLLSGALAGQRLFESQQPFEISAPVAIAWRRSSVRRSNASDSVWLVVCAAQASGQLMISTGAPGPARARGSQVIPTRPARRKHDAERGR